MVTNLLESKLNKYVCNKLIQFGFKRLGPIFPSHTTALVVSVFGIGIGILELLAHIALLELGDWLLIKDN